MSGISAEQLRDMLLGGARRVCENRAAVDELNVFPVPDGDTGTNMCATLERMRVSLGGRFAGPREVAEAAARGALMGARGNSGVILSQVLKGFSDGIDGGGEINAIVMSQALAEAADRAYQAVIKPVEGTILTVLKEAATAAGLSVSGADTPVGDVLDAALLQARHTLARTPEMLDKLKSAGVVDAGGQGLIHFFEGMMLVLRGEMEVGPVLVEEEAPHAEADLKFRYCTEVVVTADAGFSEDLKEILEGETDSLIVVGDGGTVKLHAHTNDPGKVISLAQAGGELLDVKVDNMALQHREKLDVAARAPAAGKRPEPAAPKKEIGVVAVVSGTGFMEIFRSLGVDGFVEGGQSMNPSTEDIAAAVMKLGAREALVLPNNKNIIMSAESAARLVGIPLYVVPTKTIPQGFAAMMEFEGEGPAAGRAERMSAAARAVSSAEVTRAVRDASAGGKEILKGDFISIINGDLMVSAKTLEGALEETIEIFHDSDCEIITVYRGEAVDESEAREIFALLEEKFAGLEFEYHYGGQPNYHFIISAE